MPRRVRGYGRVHTYNFAEELESANSLWRWHPDDAERKRPHAILTSGLHSDGYLNISEFGTHALWLEEACSKLIEKLKELKAIDEFTKDLDWVVGSAMGGIVIAHELARQLGIRSAYTEKSGADMVLSRFSIKPGSTVLIPEDVSSTGETSMKTEKVLRDAGCKILPYIPTLVSRMSEGTIRASNGDKFYIVYLAKLVFQTWHADACEMCKAGSPALRPKEHWDRFVER